ncbi:hypothetical protein ACEPPN_007393 [Leptodophora sp. 'Broadleaf-Isolate-01']
MDVCSVCRNIPFESLPSEDEPAIPHYESLEALTESAKKCYLCSLILGMAGQLCQIQQNIKEGKHRDNPGGWISITAGDMLPSGKPVMCSSVEGNISVGGGLMAGPGGYKGPIYFSPCKMFPRGSKVRPWLFGNWWNLDGRSEPQLVGMGVRLGETGIVTQAVGNAEDRIEYGGSNIRIRTDNKSLFGFLQARSWIDKCDKTHSCKPQNQALPSRVLVIDESSSSGKIQLLETRGFIGRYVALSHCWGLSHRIVTTKANLNDMKRGIVVEDLPRTFRDAVVITHLLGIIYLWIDSLCIIQDDAQDWEREAALMGDVYANSYLTIAASSSTDDSSGCFPSQDDRCSMSHISSDNRSLGRPTLANAAPMIYLQPGNPVPAFAVMQTVACLEHVPRSGGQKAMLYFSEEWMPTSLKKKPRTYQIGKFGGSFDPLDREPLSKRAWTLQERLLAPRVLHYGKEQMYWECQEGLFPEDGAIFPRVFPSMRTLLDLPAPDLARSLQGLHLGVDNATPKFTFDSKGVLAWGDAWLKLIEKYTRRSLTREEDKFPALSGLARSIASYTKDTYHAGIWKSYLMQGLFWEVYAFEPYHFCNNPEHDTDTAEKSSVRRLEKYRAPSWSWAAFDAKIEFKPLKKELVAECLECITPAAGEDQFGRLKEGGYIKLRAPLLSLYFTPSRHVPGSANPTPFTTNVSATFRTKYTTLVCEGSAKFDQEPEFPCSAVFLDMVHALIVNRDAAGWKRIGIVSFSERDISVADFEMGRDERIAWRFGEGVDGIVIIK